MNKVPEVDESQLSEKIEILEHDIAEYQRLINDMITEIGLTE